MKKRVFYTEIAYFAGLISMAMGAAMMTKADFGLSMVIAPAYIIHLKVSQYLPFFTFGMAEYCFQGLLIVLLSAVLKKFRPIYLTSFVTAVLYGLVLDLFIRLFSPAPDFIWVRLIFYLAGLLLTALGVSMFFHTYLPPESYELVVKEISAKKRVDINRLKIVYDLSSLALAVILSFSFFGLWQFKGVNIGTLFCAAVNGIIIGALSSFFEKRFEFRDRFAFRKYFDPAAR